MCRVTDATNATTRPSTPTSADVDPGDAMWVLEHLKVCLHTPRTLASPDGRLGDGDDL